MESDKYSPILSLVIPTYNERKNIPTLVANVSKVLESINWEMIIVDDDSPDHTYDEVTRLAREEPRIRCLRRVGRRGLASAVIEGALVANGDIIAVMDADFQHDETILPLMYHKLIDEGADLVVGTRYAAGGGVGDWDQSRQKMSNFATRLADLLIKHQTSDPMSGFFVVRRAVLASSIYDLSLQGYKILLDIISASPKPLKIAEVPYTFRGRREGESKISPMVLAEFLFLLLEKASGGLIPPRFILFCLVGGTGLFIHLLVLNGLGHFFNLPFLTSQAAAIIVSMLSNFVINNRFTYSDRRLTGLSAVAGAILFCIVCSIGALANIGVAELAIKETSNWSLAGFAGAIMGAVFNFGAASSLVWRHRRRRNAIFEMPFAGEVATA